MLTFWRYGENGHNSHKYDYRATPKQRRTLKTYKIRLAKRVEELGYNPKIWTFEELDNYGSELPDDIWHLLKDDDQILEFLSVMRSISKFTNKDSFHAPPCSRGIYVFPEKMVEWFLVGWKASLKKTTINYNGDKLWCHFEEECEELGVQILQRSRHWVLIHSSDFKRVLNRAKIKDIRQRRVDFGGHKATYLNQRNMSKFISLDRYEVFIVV